MNNMKIFNHVLPIRECVFPAVGTVLVRVWDTIGWDPLKFTKEPIFWAVEPFDSPTKLASPKITH